MAYIFFFSFQNCPYVYFCGWFESLAPVCFFRLVVVDEVVRMYVYNKLQHKIYSDFGIIPRRMVMVRGWRWRWRRVGDGETARQISRRRCGSGGGWRADGSYRRLTAHHGLASFNTAGTATDRLLLLLLMMSIAAASIGVRKSRTWAGTVIRVPCKVMTICSRKKNKGSDS